MGVRVTRVWVEGETRRRLAAMKSYSDSTRTARPVSPIGKRVEQVLLAEVRSTLTGRSFEPEVGSQVQEQGQAQPRLRLYSLSLFTKGGTVIGVEK